MIHADGDVRAPAERGNDVKADEDVRAPAESAQIRLKNRSDIRLTQYTERHLEGSAPLILI